MMPFVLPDPRAPPRQISARRSYLCSRGRCCRSWPPVPMSVRWPSRSLWRAWRARCGWCGLAALTATVSRETLWATDEVAEQQAGKETPPADLSKADASELIDAARCRRIKPGDQDPRRLHRTRTVRSARSTPPRCRLSSAGSRVVGFRVRPGTIPSSRPPPARARARTWRRSRAVGNRQDRSSSRAPACSRHGRFPSVSG